MVLSRLLIWIPCSIILIIFVFILITSYICYKIIFCRIIEKDIPKYPLPPGRAYEKYKDEIISYMKEVDQIKYKDVSITSFDGLKLCGKYYECEKNAPIELMVHGYRGDSRRDLSGGVIRAFKQNRNVLLIDNRASGRSEGKVITFGVKESKDCISWINFIITNINKEAKIILTGVSMGAATVMIAASETLPNNVVAVLADCGYTSTKAIIKKVIKGMKLPPNFLYFFVKLGAIIFGKFTPDKVSPIKAMETSKLPIIFFHGDDDRFVPCDMSIENYNKCISPKHLVLVKNAGHCLCYTQDSENYLKELEKFFTPILNN